MVQTVRCPVNLSIPCANSAPLVAIAWRVVEVPAEYQEGSRSLGNRREQWRGVLRSLPESRQHLRNPALRITWFATHTAMPCPCKFRALFHWMRVVKTPVFPKSTVQPFRPSCCRSKNLHSSALLVCFPRHTTLAKTNLFSENPAKL